MIPPRQIHSGWPWFTRRRMAAALVGACAVAASASAQVRPTPSPSTPPPRATPAPPPEPVAAPVVIDPAERALLESRFADVDVLAAEPDAPPVRRIALALAEEARGRYDAARERLEPEAAADPGGEAALELGLLLMRLGRREAAVQQLSAVAAAPQAGERSAVRLLRLGRALAALGQPRRANSILQEAAALAPADPRPATAWAQLFLDKHNLKEAVELFTTALRLDDRWVPALLGLARAVADDDGAASAQAIQRVLAIAPASTEARLVLAERALDERRLADAGRELAQVVVVNAASIEAMALQAAIAAIEDRPDDADRLAQQALAVNPRAGDVYRTIGEQLAAHYRFEEAVVFLRKGAAIEPGNPRVLAALGLHLLRTGDEAAARRALDDAFKRDPFDVVTYNLLALLDTLDKFETVADGDLIVKLHPEEARVMREPVTTLAQRALVALGTRYDVTPRGPILIEMFPRHDDFAVRTLGLPGMVGALGACFGRVVTLDSPRAQKPPGTFNWQATLWHELAHVITLQLSAQRVPRWLTEGASVFEERRADPAWGREGEHDFLQAYARGALIPLATLNAGFTDRRTIGLAYHQSSLVVEHLVDRFGDAGVQRLLKAFGAGQAQEAALQSALGVSIDAVQTSFDAFLVDRFAKVRTALTPVEDAMPDGEGPEGIAALMAYADRHADRYAVQLAAGRLLAARGAAEAARRVLERAVTLVPQTMGDESPRVGLAELAAGRQDRGRAMVELEQVLASSHTAMESARRLLAIAREANDSARVGVAVDRIVALDPFEGAAHAERGRLALGRDDGPGAIRAFELALSLNPSDLVAVHTDLAEAYLLSGQLDAVRRHAIRALELAPRYERAQELLLRVVDGR